MEVKLAFVILFVFYPPPTTPDWTSECASRYKATCRCTWSSGKRLADCQKSNMNALPILSNEIQILDMSGNKLSQLTDNAFTQANLINLQKLYMKSCRITRLHELAFNNLRILIEIDLSHNEIEVVDPLVFSTNVRLRVIKLNNNKVHTVRDFPFLEYLNTLDLSYNSISGLNFSFYTFKNLRNLKVLDLSYNLLSNINPEVLPKLSSLSLRGNAWVCDCELKSLREYVIVNKFYEPDLRCSEPLSLFNAQWDAFDELSCKPEIVHILANGKVVDSIVAMESTLVLSCVVRGDPTPDVKWVKNGRVVQEAVGSSELVEHHTTVVLNLTVSKHDNEFVCVGSNSGGVVERNLTVTVDEAGLSVVFKDGGLVMGDRDRGASNLVVYLVIAVVFLSLLVGLVVGGVCVWRWGARGRDRDGVVKGAAVVKDDGKDEQVVVNQDDVDVQINNQQFEQTITNQQQQRYQHYGTVTPTQQQRYTRTVAPYQQEYRYSTLNNTRRYYDYDDNVPYRKYSHPHEMYDTVVYTNRNTYSDPPVNQVVSPDICDLIVPPPPPPPSSTIHETQFGSSGAAPPPPLEFCECNKDEEEQRQASIHEKVSCLQDFRTRVIMIGGVGSSVNNNVKLNNSVDKT